MLAAGVCRSVLFTVIVFLLYPFFLGSYSGPVVAGELAITGNTNESTIEAVNQFHPAFGQTLLNASGITLQAGSSVAITAFADQGSNVIRATTATAHGFSTGDPIAVLGADVEAGDANPYYGIYSITVFDADEFDFTCVGCWNATTTAVATRPDSFVIPSYGGGTYRFTATASFSAAANSKTYDFWLYKDITQIPHITTRFQSKNADVFASVVGTGTFTAEGGDKIWYGAANVDDATNFTLRNTNIVIERRN